MSSTKLASFDIAKHEFYDRLFNSILRVQLIVEVASRHVRQTATDQETNPLTFFPVSFFFLFLYYYQFKCIAISYTLSCLFIANPAAIVFLKLLENFTLTSEKGTEIRNVSYFRIISLKKKEKKRQQKIVQSQLLLLHILYRDLQHSHLL